MAILRRLCHGLGNVSRCGVVTKFSDLEVAALGITAEAFRFESEDVQCERMGILALFSSFNIQLRKFFLK